MGTAIYNHIVYALYHEMRNNPQSKIVDEIYKCERNDISLHKKLLEYLQYLRDVKKGDYYKVKNTGVLSDVPHIYCNSKNINFVYDAMVAGMNAGEAVA